MTFRSIITIVIILAIGYVIGRKFPQLGAPLGV